MFLYLRNFLIFFFQGQSAILEEFEKLKIANTNLEKVNLKLESENLSLKLKIEKEKVETKYFMEKIKHLQQAKEEVGLFAI